MTQYTNQTAFDLAYKHLLAQNERSTEDGHCKYRSSTGLMCAVGCLIPDEVYDPVYDHSETGGTGIKMILMRHAELAGLFDGVDPDLLQSLQQVHDSYLIGDWKDQLGVVAAQYELTVPEMA